MTTSAAFNFGVNTELQSVIDEAFERLGRQASDLSANDIQSAIRSMTYLFSEFANRGVNLWEVSLLSTALTQGQSTITLSAENVDVLQVYKRQTSGGVNTDTILSPISRAEYAALPNKLQQGVPTQFYLERTIVPTMYLYLTPQDSSFTLFYYVMNMTQDPGSPTNTLFAPQRWFDAIASGTAARLAGKWAPDRKADLIADFDRAYEFAAAEDAENVPLRIVPDNLGRRWN